MEPILVLAATLGTILSLLLVILFVWLLYWIGQFFKQKAITEQQKNKQGKYKNDNLLQPQKAPPKNSDK